MDHVPGPAVATVQDRRNVWGTSEKMPKLSSDEPSLLECAGHPLREFGECIEHLLQVTLGDP